jgi:hypothetical protein
MKNTDPYEPIRKANTDGANYGLDTEAIVARLRQWESLCEFRVSEAGHDTVNIEFETLPKDLDAFVRDLYDFCPDLVDQGTGCMQEMVEMIEETGEGLEPEMKKLIEGVDFEDENYGLEILKRSLQQGKSVRLWWD